jgi:hypothetical protein
LGCQHSRRASTEIDQEIEWATVAGMLNLRNVLALVVDGFNHGAVAQEQSIGVAPGLIIFAELGDALERVVGNELKK